MSKRPVVTVNEGKLLGKKEISTFSGLEYLAFYGVPYGEPPVGNLRFRDPIKVKPWKGLRSATTPKDGCVQYSTKHLEYMGTEDCLYVNIYTRALQSSIEPLKAVIVCLHPGGHLWGSPDPSNHGSPDFVIHNDIVYVTICYRLHVLGFLNLNIKDCAGNQAVKDIIMAFQWIKANIERFNGDPNNITALGSSSSSAMVHSLMLIPSGRGLFHKAILMGLHWHNCLISVEHQHTSIAYEFAQALDFTGDSPKSLMNFLKTLPAMDLVKQLRKTFENYHEKIARIFPTAVFVYTDDYGKVATQEHLKNIDGTARIPVMFGICEKEAVIGFIGRNREATETFYKTSIRQNVHGWPRNIDEKTSRELFQQVENFYFQDNQKNCNSLSTKIDILTDAGLSDLYPKVLDVISADLPSSVFVYKFEYDGELGALKNISNLRGRIGRLKDENVTGTFHSDDFGYWAYINDPTSDTTKSVVQTFTKLICTFAKTGNPNYEGLDVQWRPSDQENPCYLSINEKLQMIDGKLNNDRIRFWETLAKQYGKENQ